MVLAVLAMPPALLYAQSASLEVASIRLNTDETSPSIAPGLRNGRLSAVRVTARMLLASAYNVTRPQVMGPEWLDQDRFDILAKAAEGTPATALGAMLQSLLKERFHLTAHLETRAMAAYYLVVAEGGVKMSAYPAPPKDLVDEASARGFPMMRGTATMEQLARTLSSVLGKPVMDRTGLTERYHYFLSYAPFTPRAGAETPDFGPPDIATALSRQLGLKLQPVKAGVTVVVVDAIERRPTGN